MYIKKLFLVQWILLLLFLSACSEKVEERELREDLGEFGCVDVEKSLALDLVLVLDSSGSMQKNDPTDLRIKDSKLIVEKMKDDDRALVVSFDNEARLMMDNFSSDKDEIISALDKVASDKKYTNLGAALDVSINSFKNDVKDRQKVIIALTDGENAGENDDMTEGMNTDSYNQALNASNQDIAIYTIGLGQDIDEELLKTIADTSSGKYFNAENSFKLEEVYRRVVKEIECQSPKEKRDENEEYIIFKDANLKRLITEVLDQPENYNPTQSDMLRLVEIDGSNIEEYSIKSVEGLEYALNLESLNLKQQEIKNLSPLFGLNNLHQLEINNETGDLSLLSKSEKNFYANYIIDLENKSADTKFLSGKITDINKDHTADFIAIFKQQCANVSFQSDCIFIKVLTVDNGKLEILYDTEEFAENPQQYLLELGGGTLYDSEVYIEASGSKFGLVIHTPGNVYRTTIDYYQFISFDEDLFSHAEIVKKTSECNDWDEECNKKYPEGQDVDVIPLKGNLNIKSVTEFIESATIKISFDSTHPQFDDLYNFATVKKIVNSNSYIRSPEMRLILKEHAFLKSEINKDDSYGDVLDKSIEQPIFDDFYNGGWCTGYDSFAVCKESYLPVLEDGEITAVILSPHRILTVKDIEDRLNTKLNIEYAEEGLDWGKYSSQYEFEGQYYGFTSESDSPDSLISEIFIQDVVN